MTIDRVQDLIGTPYELGGREPGERLDCLGAVICGRERLGLNGTFDPWERICEQYDAGWRGFESQLQQRNGWARVTALAAGDLEEGDVLLFGADHVALYLGDGYVLHAREGRGTYARRLSREWVSVASVWRWVE